MVNSRGQAMVEALGGFVVLTLAILLLLKPALRWVERLWIENCAHNSLRCELRGKNHTKCITELRQCSAHLPWGEFQNLQLMSKINQQQKKVAQVELKWCTHKGESPCLEKNQMQIQMQLRESRITALSWSDGLRSRPLF
jgi:hypothetical protein